MRSSCCAEGLRVRGAAAGGDAAGDAAPHAGRPWRTGGKADGRQGGRAGCAAGPAGRLEAATGHAPWRGTTRRASRGTDRGGPRHRGGRSDRRECDERALAQARARRQALGDGHRRWQRAGAAPGTTGLHAGCAGNRGFARVSGRVASPRPCAGDPLARSASALRGAGQRVAARDPLTCGGASTLEAHDGRRRWRHAEKRDGG